MQVGVRASMLGPVKFGVERDRLRAEFAAEMQRLDDA